MDKYGIIDLFAGPGGLGEGFAGFQTTQGHFPFEIKLSAEAEIHASRTLQRRALTRILSRSGECRASEAVSLTFDEMKSKWRSAASDAMVEARRLKLGEPQSDGEVDKAIAETKRLYGDRTIVIGGPPCQAYSLVGRSRNKGKKGYTLAEDEKTFLFRQYVRVLNRMRPAVFIMENVKGLLSARVDSDHVFDLIRRELTIMKGQREYQLLAVTPSEAIKGETMAPSDFIVRSEQHGVPQARHRVILVGIRNDLMEQSRHTGSNTIARLAMEQTVTCGDVINSLPRLRSGLSLVEQDDKAWRREVSRIMRDVCRELPRRDPLLGPVRDAAEVYRREFCNGLELTRSSEQLTLRMPVNVNRKLRRFIQLPKGNRLTSHNTRSHNSGDLGRYFFCAAFAREHGRSPLSNEFPATLAPAHKNWFSGNHVDRFRVQRSDRPAHTIVSHISKDGHANIHPDPCQCRSLTVREAARIQTFPDDYVFEGARTHQYIQVGNAVPPFLARQLAGCLYEILSSTS